MQAVRRIVRRAAPGAGAAAPRVARRAAVVATGARLGGLACLMAPLLAPTPAMGPLDTPPIAARALPVTAAPMPTGTGLMAADASVTGFETWTLGPQPGTRTAEAMARPVVVPEPGTAVLFATGIAALLWTRRRRAGGSGLDGAGGRR
jgi:hypothetical protein